VRDAPEVVEAAFVLGGVVGDAEVLESPSNAPGRVEVVEGVGDLFLWVVSSCWICDEDADFLPREMAARTTFLDLS
jgi:hypothetical protein